MSEEEKASRETSVRRGKPRTKANGQHPPNGTQFEADGTVTVSWEQLGLSASKYGPYPNIDNTLRILGSHPELVGRIWYDEFNDRMYSDLWGEVLEWTDEHDIRLTAWIQRHVAMPKLTKGTVRDAVEQWARLHVRNEPKEWMDSLIWDRTPRLIHMMADGFGAEQNEYTAAVGRCWLTSMVARIYQPGAKVDYMPVFEGAQGINKSFALDAIGGKWFAESHEDITSKDFRQTLRGKMLVEFSELHAFKRAEIERIKGMITCRVDRYRESYGRHAKDYPRRCVFAGTTNRDDWVNDDTGARRFWPIRCTSISLDYLRGNREQLFAEAVSLFKAGAQWWDINQDLASQEQNERRDDDVWTSPVLNYAERKEFVIVREILTDVLGIEAKGQTSAEAMRVSRILRIAGYSKYQKWYLGRNEKVWKKPFKLDQLSNGADI